MVPALSVAFAALSNVSYALLTGAFLAAYWLAKPGSPVPSLRPLSLGCAAALTLGHLVHPWFVAAGMSGLSQFHQVLSLTPTVLSSTRQGTIWYANSAILAVLWGGLLSRARLPIGALSLCLLAAAKAMSTHAADAGDFSIPEISEFLHIVATATWAGAVIVSGLLVAPRLRRLKEPAAVWSYGTRLSAAVTWALVVLIASGFYISYRELNGHLSGLWSTGWGRILIAKLTLVLLAVVLGAINRLNLKRPANETRAALLVRVLRIEAGVMLLILCLSALLASTSPEAQA